MQQSPTELKRIITHIAHHRSKAIYIGKGRAYIRAAADIRDKREREVHAVHNRALLSRDVTGESTHASNAYVILDAIRPYYTPR